jgi:hypothetical protein
MYFPSLLLLSFTGRNPKSSRFCGNGVVVVVTFLKVLFWV